MIVFVLCYFMLIFLLNFGLKLLTRPHTYSIFVLVVLATIKHHMSFFLVFLLSINTFVFSVVCVILTHLPPLNIGLHLDMLLVFSLATLPPPIAY